MAAAAAPHLMRFLRRGFFAMLGLLVLVSVATPALAAQASDTWACTQSSAGEAQFSEDDEVPARPDAGSSHSGYHLTGEPQAMRMCAALDLRFALVEVGGAIAAHALRPVLLMPPAEPPRA